VPKLRKVTRWIAWLFTRTLGLITVDPQTFKITSTIEEMAHAHDEWAKKVKEMVPAARLLVHKSADGWEPVCAALKLDVPSEPRLKDSKQISTILWRVRVVSTVFWPVGLAAVGIGMWANAELKRAD